MDEFVEALVRLGSDAYQDEGDMADRLRILIDSHFVPYLETIETTSTEALNIPCLNTHWFCLVV